MVYVHIKNNPFDKSFNDDLLIRFHEIAIGNEEDWGDEDCNKFVTEAYSCDITIDASVKDNFINEDNKYEAISFVRYGYYNPAYYIDLDKTKFKIIENEDGSITYQIRAIKER